MRFGVVHRFMTNALAALGVLALVSSGQFSRVVSLVVLGGLLLALLVRESWQRHPAFRHVDTVSLVLVIALQVTRFILGASSLDVLIEFAAALQIIRLATRRGAVHDQQVIVLALLHLIAGTVLGGGLGYGLCFAGVLIVAPGALVLSHLRREVEGNYRQGARDRTGLPVDVPRILRSRRVVGRSFILATCLLSIPIFIFTAMLFIAFPRVGLSLLQLNQNHQGPIIGFSDHIDLATSGALRTDPTPAMRITIPGLGDNPPSWMTMHLRGRALDNYDGKGWSQSDAQLHAIEMYDSPIPLDPDSNPWVSDKPWRVDLDPFEPPILFFPEHTTAFSFQRPDSILGSSKVSPMRGADGEFRYQPSEHGIEYLVYVDRSQTTFRSPLSAHERQMYVRLPEIPARIGELAAEWTANASTTREKAAAIVERLHHDYAYDLDTPSGKADDPLDHFLFESHKGHCEYFSTALAVMLRTLDVPARTVNGFAGGTYNRFGKFYVVRQGDAHTWVEVFVDGEGWATFDPTPPAGSAPQVESSGIIATLRDLIEATSERWDRHVVNYDLDQQYGLFRSFSGGDRRASGGRSIGGRTTWIALGALVVIGGGVILYLRRRRSPPSPAPKPLKRTKSEIAATQLYEHLEAAMGANGIHRPLGTPPLRHAQSLAESAHALADPILEVTQAYLGARFGGAALSEARLHELEARIRQIRLAASEAKSRANASPPSRAPRSGADTAQA
ncbi:MAG: transglutaminaseTgpA domain-containing protein [Polyangiaceae bacterium]